MVSRDNPGVFTCDSSEFSSRVRDGEALDFGGLYWPHPWPPTAEERAGIVGSVVPTGVLMAGATAGWVWTGMGVPTPLSLLPTRHPGPSPLARQSWRVRGATVPTSQQTVLGGHRLLTRQATVLDLLSVGGRDDVMAAQLFVLSAELGHKLPAHTDIPPSHRTRANRRRQLVEAWRLDYPWATR